MNPGGSRELSAWWRLGLAVVRPVFRAMFRLRIVGEEWIPTAGPAIIAANHRSVLDGVVMALVPAERGRATRFLVAAEIFRSMWVGWALRAFEQIPIRRGESDRGALDEAIDTVRAGALAGVFPEGKINDRPGFLRGHSGVARIAIATGAPIVPVGIWGTHHRWPRSGPTLRPPLRPQVTVVVGRPIEPAGRPDDIDDARALADHVMDRIADLVAEAQTLAG